MAPIIPMGKRILPDKFIEKIIRIYSINFLEWWADLEPCTGLAIAADKSWPPIFDGRRATDATLVSLGSVHKVRHAILEHFDLPQPVAHLGTHVILSSTCIHTCVFTEVSLGSRGYLSSRFFVWKVLSGVVFVHPPFCQNTSITT